VDTRDSPEQAELRRSARQLAHELGPGTVAGLDDDARRARLAAAVGDAGWLELRDDAGNGAPVATGAEAAIVAEALGEAVADTPFTGPVLARDLLRRGRAPSLDAAIALSTDLTAAAIVEGSATTEAVHVLDAAPDATSAIVLVPGGEGFFRLGRVPVVGAARGSDLTRALRTVPIGAPVESIEGSIGADELAAWTALGLALTSADLVGVMRGALDVTVAYAAERKQYGVAVGSFQAVQHLLAEARCLLEGSASAALYAGWAVDSTSPADAIAAGRVAKTYCARAARTVCETAVQVHGGIGNTWECVVHVYLRRALLSSQWFGDDAVQLAALQAERLGVTVGLP
jgi:alkylation response protein AidB-like acyl-CoA dehydrogenase